MASAVGGDVAAAAAAAANNVAATAAVSLGGGGGGGAAAAAGAYVAAMQSSLDGAEGESEEIESGAWQEKRVAHLAAEYILLYCHLKSIRCSPQQMSS